LHLGRWRVARGVDDNHRQAWRDAVLDHAEELGGEPVGLRPPLDGQAGQVFPLQVVQRIDRHGGRTRIGLGR
jgi:hypothetical protein